MNCTAWDYRIALTEAGLARGYWAAYDIPLPQLAPLLDSSQENARSAGGQALHGYIYMPILWQRLSMYQAFRIRKFIDSAKAGTGLLYMTVDRNDTLYGGPHFVDISGYPHRAREAADDGDMAARAPGGGQYTDNYNLLMNNITIINDPSLYTVL